MVAVLTTSAKATAEDWLKLSGEEGRFELVDGEIINMGGSGIRQAGVSMRLAGRFYQWVEGRQLGEVYTDAGFKIGENIRVPDVAFVSAARFPESGEPVGFAPFVPDLAAEVVSPHDLFEDVMRKLVEYVRAGVKQVWLISPEARLVMVFRSLTDVKVFGENDELEADDLLPGFRCPVSDLFKQPVSPSQ